MGQGAIYPDLANKAVIVTGGATGIGEAIVRAFVRQDCKVGFIDLQADVGHDLAKALKAGGGQGHFVHADLTDVAAIKNAVGDIRRAFGPIDILINNAAHDERHATQSVTSDYFDEKIAINLKHAFFAAQAVLPDMVEKQAGAIVNFSSISWMASMGGMAVYTAAKSAMLGLTRSLARDYGAHNIRVNAIAPGWILTDRQKKLWVTPEGEQTMLEAQCLKRWLMPEEIAKFAIFLASEEASACTGQHYVVDGGWV
jgi:D-xylose 1-dehydrogenase